MKTTRLLPVGLCVLVASAGSVARAQDPAKARLGKSPRHHEWAQVKTQGGRTVKCFVVFPEVNKPATTVVVIHENRGLTDWVRSVADQFAEAGYLAVAPDFLSGTGPGGGGTDAFESSDAARNGISKLSREQVLEDLDGVVKYARGLEASNKKVAVGGFCWGGGQTFSYACRNRDIAAAFVFYGQAPRDDAFQTIAAPVYGFYGEKDFRITGQVSKIAASMKEIGKSYEPVTYPGAGHGFMRSGEEPNADSANREARQEGWKRWKSILAKL